MRTLFSLRHSLLSAVTLTSLVTALLLPSAVFAQEDKNKEDNDKVERLNVNTVYVGDGVTFSSNDNTEMRKKVSLEANNMPVVEALKKVLEQAGITCVIDADVPTDKTVTLTVKNVPLSMVLNLLTQEAEVGWSYYRKVEGDKKESKIQIGKKRRQGLRVVPSGRATASTMAGEGNIQIQVGEAMRAAQDAIRQSQLFMPSSMMISARLPDTRVKLDVHNSNIRDALKDVLKQAGMDYALEDDVPDDVKRSFTFENVPIGTALDVICRSADIGWTVQVPASRTLTLTPGEEPKKEKKKVLILIGKKYAKRWNNVYGANIPDAMNMVPALAPLLGGDTLFDFPAPASISIPPMPAIPALPDTNLESADQEDWDMAADIDLDNDSDSDRDIDV